MLCLTCLSSRIIEEISLDFVHDVFFWLPLLGLEGTLIFSFDMFFIGLLIRLVATDFKRSSLASLMTALVSLRKSSVCLSEMFMIVEYKEVSSFKERKWKFYESAWKSSSSKKFQGKGSSFPRFSS